MTFLGASVLGRPLYSRQARGLRVQVMVLKRGSYDGVIAALVAAYALTDELGMAFLCLLDPLGIGYLATADADEVYLIRNRL